MHPILFNVGSFEFRSFTAAFLVATISGLIWARQRATSAGYNAEKVMDWAVWMVIGGALGARIVFIVQDLPYFLSHKDQLFSLKWEGLTSFGGPLFAIPIGLYGAKKLGLSGRQFLDIFAGPMLLAHAIGRIGCFFNGCCYGGACSASTPLALHVDGGYHYPAQLGDSAMNLVALGILVALERRGLKPGMSAGFFLFFHGLARFIYEFWRAGASSTFVQVGGKSLPLTEAHFVAIFIMVAGFVTLAISSKSAAQTAMPEPTG